LNTLKKCTTRRNKTSLRTVKLNTKVIPAAPRRDSSGIPGHFSIVSHRISWVISKPTTPIATGDGLHALLPPVFARTEYPVHAEKVRPAPDTARKPAVAANDQGISSTRAG
jgi:hypothetical protein